MKVFYGGIFIEGEALQEAGLQHPIKLEYYKTINKETNKYGIDIVKTEYNKNQINTEEKEIKYLSNDESKIEKLLNLFKQNTVTPVTAEYITEDILKTNFLN